jgi:lysophospholipase L1-like esterase
VVDEGRSPEAIPASGNIGDAWMHLPSLEPRRIDPPRRSEERSPRMKTLPGRCAILIAGALLAFTSLLPAASAAGALPPKFDPPKRYYLALGDSLAFGFQFQIFNANFPAEPPAAYATGYVDAFGSLLQQVKPESQTVNLGCPGETTATFIAGSCPYTAGGFALHTAYAGPQLAAAVAFLGEHPGQVSPITVNLGTNDINILIALCGADVACYNQHGPGVIAQIATNLALLLAALRQAAPDSEILTMTNYAVAPAFQPLIDALNAAIAATAAAQRVRVADVVTPFGAGPQPATLCQLTLICAPLQDSHPSDAGYQVIAQQFWAASGYAP